MKYLSAIACLCFLLLSAGCTDNTNEPTEQDVIMPLAVGNMWVAKTSVLDTNGNLLDTFFDTLKIVSEVIIDGQKWYKDKSDMQLFRNTSWGLMMKNDFFDYIEMPFVKYPSSVGEYVIIDSLKRFSPQGTLIDTLTAGYMLAAKDTSITVPFGTFSCHYYKMICKTFNGDIVDNISIPFFGDVFLCPNKGTIKQKLDRLEIGEYGIVNMVSEIVYIELH